MPAIMIMFLYGPDTYRSRQKLNEIISHYKKIHKSGLNLKYFDESLDYDDFKNELGHIPMFAEKKMIILENAFLSQQFRESFLKDIGIYDKIADIIVFREEKEDLPKGLPAILKKHAKVQEFKLLGGNELIGWIKQEFEKYSMAPAPGSAGELAGLVGNDLWRLSNEVKKLAAYKKSGTIGSKEVRLLVRSKIDADIFKTIDSISSKNKEQALELLRNHIEKGDSPLYLLSMINFQFRNILQVRDLVEKGQTYYQISKELKLHPFVIRKSYQQAQKFTMQGLIKIYQNIFKIDRQIKTGQVDAQTALDLLVAGI